MNENEIVTPQYNVREEVAAPEKPKYSAFEGVMAAATLLFGFGFIKFVIAGGLGMAAAVFFVLFLITAVIFINKKEVKPALSSYVSFGVVLAFAASFGLFDNPFIKVLNLFFVVGGTAYWMYSACYDITSIRDNLFFDFMTSFFKVPFGSFGVCSSAIGSLIGRSKSAKNGRMIFLGVLIAVPITVIVASLLASSDVMFENMMSGFFEGSFFDIVVFFIQFAIGIPIAFYIYGMLWGNAGKLATNVPNDEANEKFTTGMRFAPSVMMYASVTPICILYVLYFIAQSGYFLSAFQSCLPEGYSYAEYARRGFFELFAVALINLGIILVLQLFCKRNEEKKPVGLKAYTVIISAFTLMLIATALSKMFMYIESYGLTQLRVYTSWFMILLAFMFVFIIIKQIAEKFNLAKGIAYSFVVMFAILNFGNIDGMIVRYNVNAYLTGALPEIDVYMMNDLAPSAAEYALPLLEDDDDGVREDALNYLAKAYNRSETEDYRRINMSEQRVHDILGQYEEISDKATEMNYYY